MISEINNKHTIIANPFGEVYPENDTDSSNCFNIIKEYIINGGTFVGCGGLQFFYAWDTNHGVTTRLKAISGRKIMHPTTIHVEAGTMSLREILDFSGTQLWKEFGVQTTSDTPVQSGHAYMRIYQEKEDIEKIGDLIHIGGSDSVFEYRALLFGSNTNLIPFARTRRPDFDSVLIPLGAIPKGQGYLIYEGMRMDTPQEFEKMFTAIDRFIDFIKPSP